LYQDGKRLVVFTALDFHCKLDDWTMCRLIRVGTADPRIVVVATGMECVTKAGIREEPWFRTSFQATILVSPASAIRIDRA
jgi:hypothetical protein